MERRHNDTIDIHHLDSCGTDNMNFSFVCRMSIKDSGDLGFYLGEPQLAFSADGSKFAMARARGRVSVWNIRSRVPLKTFTEVPKSGYNVRPVRHLQFSSGKRGKEALVFVEVCLMLTFRSPQLSNRLSEPLAQ